MSATLSKPWNIEPFEIDLGQQCPRVWSLHPELYSGTWSAPKTIPVVPVDYSSEGPPLENPDWSLVDGAPSYH